MAKSKSDKTPKPDTGNPGSQSEESPAGAPGSDPGSEDDSPRGATAGGSGDDLMEGTAAADRLVGGAGDDTLVGAGGDDDLNAGSGDDELRGGAGDDVLKGVAGNDTLDGGAGDDDLRAGDGDDQALYVAADNVGATDVYRGDDGIDTLVLQLSLEQAISAGVQADAAAFANFVAAHTDPDTGEAGDESFRFGAFGLEASGWEQLQITVEGTTEGAAVVQAGADGDDQLDGGAEADVLLGGVGADTLVGGGANDMLFGGEGDDSLSGGAGDDVLYAGDGDDVVDGGEGDDLLIGGSGLGDDTYVGGAGNDTISYTSTSQGIQVDLGAGTASGPEIGTDTLIEIENVIGGSGADVIVGDGLGNVLQGRSGDDQLTGAGGDDDLRGGAGVDTAHFDGSLFDFAFDLATSGNGGSGTVADMDAGDGDLGTDTVSQVEALQFADGVIRLDGTDNAPYTRADAATTAENDALTFTTAALIANDFDFEGQTLTVAQMDAVSAQGAGIAVDLETQSFRYDPGTLFDDLAVGETRTDSIAFTITDGTGQSTPSSVTVTITGTNDAPAIGVGGFAGDVTELGSNADVGALGVSGSFAFDDLDLSDAHAVTAAPVGAPRGMLVPAISTVATGTGAGSVSWTYTVAAGDVADLAAGETRVESFTVAVTDEQGAEDQRQVDVTLTGTNDAPVIEVATGDSAAAQLTETDAGLTASGTLSVVDADLTDVVTASVASVQAEGTLAGLGSDDAALLSMLSVSADVIGGTTDAGALNWDFDSGAEAFDHLGVGETLTLTYTVAVTDDSETPAGDTQAVTVTITGTNDVPAIETGDLAGGVTEAGSNADAGSLEATGSFGFDDLDLTDAHAVAAAAIGGTLGTLAPTVSTAATGADSGAVSWRYSVAAADVAYLAAGESRVESFTVTVDDGQGGLSSQQIDVTITGTNDAPVIEVAAGDSAAADLTEMDGGLTASGTLSVADADLTDVVTASVASVQAEGTLAGLSSDDAALLSMLSVSGDVIDSTTDAGSLSWEFASGTEAFDHLGVGEVLTLTYTVAVTDDSETPAGDTQAVTVTITGTNDAPVIALEPAVATVSEGDDGASRTATGQVNASDADASDTLSVTVNEATHGVASVDGSSSWSYTVNDSAVVDALAAGEELTDRFTITVDDGKGATSSQEVVITVVGTNDAPIAAADTAGTTDEATAVTIDALANDSDVDHGDTLTLTAVTVTAGLGTATIVDNRIVYDPGAYADILGQGYDPAPVTLEYTVTDAHGATAIGQATLTVTGLGAGAGADEIIGTAAADQLEGLAGDDSLQGLGGDDALDGGAGNDLLDGGTGADVMQGGAGNDTYLLDSAADVVVELVDEGVDTVQAPFDYTLSSHIENLTLLDGAVTGTGNELDNAIAGTSSADTLDGASGNDTLRAHGEDDLVLGGAGNDALYGGFGNDRIEGGDGDDILSGSDPGINWIYYDGNDALIGGAGNDRLDGGNGVDVLEGGDGDDWFSGGHRNDTIDGGAGNDVVYAGLHSDLVHGGAGDDVIYGYDWRSYWYDSDAGDTLYGDAGADSIYGGAGDDVLEGGLGDDLIDGGPGFDTARWAGSIFDMTLAEAEGTWTVSDAALAAAGDEGVDAVLAVEALQFADATIYLDGRNNAPLILPLSQAATITEGDPEGQTAGGRVTAFDGDVSDTLTYTASDPAYGEAGVDATGNWTYTVGDTAAVDALAEGETLSDSFTVTVDDGNGGTANQEVQITIVGTNDAPMAVADAAGTDEATPVTIDVLANDSDVDNGDTLNLTGVTVAAGLGTASIVDDRIVYDPSAYREVLGDGYDPAPVILQYTVSDAHGATATGEATLTVNGLGAGAGADEVVGTEAADTLEAFAGDDSLQGFGGDDVLAGGAGDDLLDGGTGADVLQGGTGNDTYILDDVADAVVELADGGVDTVQVFFDYTLGAHVENLTLTGATQGTGNELANTIVGSGVSETLLGLAGNDTIRAHRGNDTIDGGQGNDALYGGFGNDRIEGGDGDDVLNGSDSGVAYYYYDGDDHLIGGAGNDRLDGGNGVDVLEGGDGDDWFSGGHFNDTIYGGAGNDVAYAGLQSDLVHGGAGDDVIHGYDWRSYWYDMDAGDRLHGDAGADSIYGGAGDDLLEGGLGDDLLDGGPGFDTARWAGSIFDMTLAANEGAWAVSDSTPEAAGGEGADTVVAVEALQFADATVYLDGRNNAPLTRPDALIIQATPGAGFAAADLTDNDFDLESGLSVDAAAVSDAGVAIKPQGDGTLSYDASGSFAQLAAGETATDSFTYEAVDQGGLRSVATVEVTIVGVNDAPTLQAADLIGAVTESVTPVGDLSDSGAITFSDVDLSDVHQVTATAVGDTLGSLTAQLQSDTTGTGAGGQLTWSYTVDAVLVESLGAGATKIDSFTVTVDDGQGGQLTSQVDVTVTGTNDAPMAADDKLGTDEDTPLIVNVGDLLSNDTDVDAGDTLTLLSVAGSTHGTANLADGVVTYTPDADYNGSDSFNYTVADAAGVESTATVQVAVAPVLDPPVGVEDIAAVRTADPTVIDLLTNDHNPDGLDLTLTEVGAPEHGTVAINDDGTVTYTPDAGFNGVDEFRYTANAAGVTVDGVATVAVANGGVTLGSADADDLRAGWQSGNAARFFLGGGGDDLLHNLGGSGAVILNGGTGSDGLYASANGGLTYMYGGDGDDRLNASRGTAHMHGGSGNDTLTTSTWTSYLYGDDGNDTLYLNSGGPTQAHGGAGDDVFWMQNYSTRSGRHYLYGDAGNDTFYGHAYGREYFAGGAGDDTFYGGYWSWAAFDGGEGNDTIIGSRRSNTYVFRPGDGVDELWEVKRHEYDTYRRRYDNIDADQTDVLRVDDAWLSDLRFEAVGDDLVVGIEGAADEVRIMDHMRWRPSLFVPMEENRDVEVLRVASHNYGIGFDHSAAFVAGTAAADTLTGGPVTYVIAGSSTTAFHATSLAGGGGDDVITGTQTSNLLLGGDGDDSIVGLGGDDTIYGGDGNDLMDGGSGIDLFGIGQGDGADTIVDDGTGVVTFEGIAAEDISLTTDGNDLVVDYGSGTVTIVDHLLEGHGVARLEFRTDPSVAAPVDVIHADRVNGYADVASAVEGSTIVMDVVANDTDILGGTVRVASVETTGTLGSVTLNADGTVTYTADGDLDALGAGETATDTFTYAAGSTSGIPADDVAVTVTVAGVNDAPTIQVDAGDSATAALAESGSGLADTGSLSVADVDVTDVVAASVTAVQANGSTDGLAADNVALLGMLSVGADVIDGTTDSGSLTWSFDSGVESFGHLAGGDVLTLTYTVQVTDDSDAAASDTQAVTVTVSGVNDAPTATDDVVGALEGTEPAVFHGVNTLSAVDLVGNDADPEAAALEIGDVEPRSAMGARVSLDGAGNVVYDTTALSAWSQLEVGETLTDTVRYRVSDGDMLSDWAVVTVTVNGPQIQSSYDAGTDTLTLSGANRGDVDFYQYSGDDLMVTWTGGGQFTAASLTAIVTDDGVLSPGQFVYGTADIDYSGHTHPNGVNYFAGGAGDDSAYGTGSSPSGDGNDILLGGGGADRITGGHNGDDVIIGGGSSDRLGGEPYDADDRTNESGADTIYGGAGGDWIYGGYDADLLHGGSGPDIIYAGEHSDTVYGGSGDDSIFGESGADDLFGGSGKDRLEGGYGSDLLDGGMGTDQLWGGYGLDTYVFGRGYGRNTIEENAFYEEDTIRVDGLWLSDLEFSRGGTYDWFDNSYYSFDALVIRILAAPEDHLVVKDQFDGSPVEVLRVGGQSVSLDPDHPQWEPHFSIGTSGNDTLHGNGQVYWPGTTSETWGYGPTGSVVAGGGGDDVIEIMAQTHNDVLLGGSGGDLLKAGNGNDLLYGGTGNDTLHGQGGLDTFGFGADGGHDTVYDDGSGILRFEGYQLDDLQLSRAGDDLLVDYGEGHRVTVVDQFLAGNGVLSFESWTDPAAASPAARARLGNDDDNALTGDSGNDVFHGFGGDDTFTTGLGSDILVFGEGGGNDTVTDFEVGVDLLLLEDGLTASAPSLIDYDGDGTMDTLVEFQDAAGNADGQVALLGVSDLPTADALFG